MIVRDVENTIVKTLKSCMSIIDKAYICDTGSIDNTKELVKKTVTKDLEFMEEKWEDFSTNRNKVLKVIEEKENSDVFILLLDANDEITGGNELLKYLEENSKYDIYWTCQVWKDTGKRIRHNTNRLIKNTKKVHYVLTVHESLIKKNDNINLLIDDKTVPNFTIYQDRDVDVNQFGEFSTMPRLKRDYELLMKEYEKNPKNTRNLYYLGQTLFFMYRFEECKKYCEERYKDFQADEETYQALLRYAKCCLFLKEPWEQVESAFWRAYNFSEKYDEKMKEIVAEKKSEEAKNISFIDIEPLIYIIGGLIDKKRYELAYALSKKICNIPVPQTLMGTDMAMYNYKRWFYLALTSEIFGEYNIGYDACNNALASDELIEAAQYYKLQKQKQHEKELVSILSTVHELRNKFTTKLNEQYIKVTDKHLVVIYGGHSYYKWNGNNIKSDKGLGGSETSAVMMAEALVRTNNYKVVIFADTEDRVTLNGVEYLRLTDYQGYVTTHHIDTLIVLRYVDAIRYGFNIKSVYVWMHDIYFVGKGIQYQPTLKGVITLCNEHANFVKSKFPKELHHIVKVIGNAIDYERFKDLKLSDKKKNRFIYSSCPTRGLELLVSLFPSIIKIMPDAELHVFSDFDNEYAKKSLSVQQLGLELKNNKYENIVYHGRVSQDKLAEEIMKSEYWLYPTLFPETYCITALEMMAGGVLPICSNYWALSEVVTNERGIMLNEYKNLMPKDENSTISEEAKILFVKEILNVLKNLDKNDIDKKRKSGIEFAKKQTWDNTMRYWISLID